MSEGRAEQKLPLRLVPRRGQALFQFFFMLFWCGFVVYWAFAFIPQFLSRNALPSLHDLTPEHLILLAPVVMLGFGLFGLVRSILALLPGSPHIYLAFTKGNLAWRHFGTERQAAWSEIRQFSLAREKSGKSYKWVLLVNGTTSDRGIGTLFKIELGKFLSTFGGEKEARGIAAWFNSLPALVDAGKLPDRLPVPENLVPSLLHRQDIPRSSNTTIEASSSRRKSVIER